MEAATTDAAVFSLTPRATEHILAIMKKDGIEGQGLRIAVVTGGCSGFEYSMKFQAQPEPRDRVIDADGLRVFLEDGSLERLAGSVLDYVAGPYGGSLKFTNPKAVHTCGCGTSFSTE
jgi:iron-sulfur cluster assembly accessory protein